ncbi:nickel transporter permease [Tissierella sp. Yu-01]|uniref:nickel transporter permease n=1 Tax=Tissierella sp. Yu-01 TaxID=3035694 RepID=UPI00240E2E8A|nr:nickel transporter permease [Tissierella sp. Yu-01]WFA09306.1 ABC transporter permease [Tissierella sp. Yu-01]
MKKIIDFIKRNKIFAVYLLLAVTLILIAVFAEYITPNNPYEGVLENSLNPPSDQYPLGTDKLGRCLLSRIIFGMRESLKLSLSLVLVIFTVGTSLGVIAGYFHGVVDMVIMRISDIMISFPGVVLAIAIAGLMGSSMMYTVIALAAINWPKYAKLSRSLVHRIKKNEYISAAVVTGTKTHNILLHYVVPNIIPTMIVTAVMDIGTMMLELAGLSFLGFGAQPPTPEWGLMLNEGRQFLQINPGLIIFPGVAIIITVIIFNLLGDSLRDILDPRQDI